MAEIKRVAVLVSGGGSNLQALIDAAAAGKMPHAQLSLVISSRAGVFALERAQKAGIKGLCVERKSYNSKESYSAAIIEQLEQHNMDAVVLAGFLSILSDEFVEKYRNRIINIHPALIPAFSGDGFYGLHVHRAALERGVKLSGATVHLVNEITDGGEILLQKAVEVEENDTPETLQQRIMEQAEWVLLPQALEMLCKNEKYWR